MKDKIELLVEVLFDYSAREDERDDAAMDLGEYNDDRALNALIQIASNEDENETVMNSAAESITEIWIKRNIFDVESFKKISPFSQKVIKEYVRNIKPEWLPYIS